MPFRGKIAVFISYSSVHEQTVAFPVRGFLESLGLAALLVAELPRPATVDWEPDQKVDYYLNQADMLVALATPDERVEGGVVRVRPNVTDEVQRARSKDHLREKIQVFKHHDVELPSNINPVYEPLDLDDVPALFERLRSQLEAWGLLPYQPQPPDRPEPSGRQVDKPVGPSVLGAAERQPSDRASDQATHALQKLWRVVGAERADDAGVAALDLARSHLLAHAAYAQRRSSSLFGAHELNTLYGPREEIALLPIERRLILRTVVAGLRADNAPGWYWLRSGRRALLDSIATLAESDADHSVRAGALGLLSEGTRHLSSPDLQRLVEAALRSDDFVVRGAGLDLLRAQGMETDLRALKSALDSASDDHQVAVTRATILTKTDPTAALKTLTNRPMSLEEGIRKQLLARAPHIAPPALEKLLRHSRAELRAFAVELMGRARTLKKAVALPIITEDPSGRVRAAALRVAVERKWLLTGDEIEAAFQAERDEVSSDEQWDLSMKAYGRWTPDRLDAGLEWVEIASWYRYAALARFHFGYMRDRIRDDLESGFAVLRARSRKRLAAEITQTVASQLKRTLGGRAPSRNEVHAAVDANLDDRLHMEERVERFVLRQFQRAALTGLAEHGDADDASWARKLIGERDPGLVDQCVTLLGRAGKKADAKRLLRLVQDSPWSEQSEQMARAALSCDPALAVAKPLLKQDNPALVQVALEGVEADSSEAALDARLDLLTRERPAVRAVALRDLVRRSTPKQLETLLALYPRRSYYYYNVVAGLDRALYGPGWLHLELAH